MKKKKLNKEAEDLVSLLDFEVISKRMENASGWDKKRIALAEKEYRRFLYLIKIHPEEGLVPSEDVDEFWHYHILDTRKYANDCQTLFGYFLHHNPNLAKGSEELEKLFKRTKELYRKSFQNEVRRSAACMGDGASCAGRCYSETIIRYEGGL